MRGLALLYLRCSTRDLPASQLTADPQGSSQHLLKESNVHKHYGVRPGQSEAVQKELHHYGL